VGSVGRLSSVNKAKPPSREASKKKKDQYLSVFLDIAFLKREYRECFLFFLSVKKYA